MGTNETNNNKYFQWISVISWKCSVNFGEFTENCGEFRWIYVKFSGFPENSNKSPEFSVKLPKIPGNSGKSPDPRQDSASGAPKSVQRYCQYWSSQVRPVWGEAAFVPRDIGAEWELGLHIWSAWSYVQIPGPIFFVFLKILIWKNVFIIFWSEKPLWDPPNSTQLAYHTKMVPKLLGILGNQKHKM